MVIPARRMSDDAPSTFHLSEIFDRSSGSTLHSQPFPPLANMATVFDTEKRDDAYHDAAPPLKDALEIIDAKDVSPDDVWRVGSRKNSS